MANLLDQASIVLTPTAYDNGKVLCAKPSEAPYGDFDFSRNSAATRVNAQGLVENVQILSSNLVQNGDFSEEGVEEVSNGSFSQEGSEQIVNGDFENGNTGWANSSINGFSVSNGKLNLLDVAYVKSTLQTNVTTVGKLYKVTYEVSNYVQGSFRLALGGTILPTTTSNGVYTYYATATSATYVVIQAFSGLPTTLSIDNVSVREVGQDWSLGTGWSIGEDKAVADGSSGNLNLTQDCLELGKTYTITYTISDYLQGSLRIKMGGWTSGSLRTSNGTYTEILSNSNPSANTSIYFQGINNFNGSITNISVKEVGQNWTLGSGWSIGEDKAIGTSATGVLYTNITITSSNKARIKADVDISGGGIQLRVGGVSLGYFYDNIDYVFTSNGNGLVEFVGQSFTGSITNISVIEISTDTSLPRINYEGFSYQDALGSELVTNGDFSDGSTGWAFAAGWSVVNNQATTLGVSLTPIRQTVLVNGTNRLTFDVVEGGALVYTNYPIFSIKATFSTVGTHTIDLLSDGVGDNRFLYIYNNGAGNSATIDNVSVKEYLGQEVVPDSGCGSWLFEPQSTNLITQSELFSDASWIKSNTSITANQIVSPDGTLNADLLTQTSNGGIIRFNATYSGSETASVFVKKGSANFVGLFSAGNEVYFDLNNGISASYSGASIVNYGIQNYGNGWYRCYLATNYTGGTSIRIYPSETDGGSASSTESVYIWGAQFEDNISYATSYIPTSGSQVTRNQDLCTNGGSLASINSTEGVLYAEIAALSDSGNCQFGLFGNSTSQQLRLEISNSIIRAQLFNGAYQANMSSTQVVTNNNKIAFKYKENDFALWVNGVEVATDNSGVTFNANELIKFNLTAQNNISLPFFGKTKAVAVWKEALSDAELAELTTI